MSKPDLIPLREAAEARDNPMVWDGEEQASGVFLDTADALDLLGTPSMALPAQPKLPPDFQVGEQLRATLAQLRAAMREVASGAVAARCVDMKNLDELSLQALLEMLGEGEVCGELSLDGVGYRVSESLLPGLWRLRGDNGAHWLEVGPVPSLVEEAAGSLRPAPVPVPVASPPGVMNGLAVLAEINEHAATWQPGDQANRVLNFTLMPMSPEDQQLLLHALGRAELVLESGGFGNCRVMATTVRHVWAVQYLNAMGNIILDTMEIGRIPDAVLAAPQDLEDSACRLDDILQAYLS